MKCRLSIALSLLYTIQTPDPIPGGSERTVTSVRSLGMFVKHFPEEIDCDLFGATGITSCCSVEPLSPALFMKPPLPWAVFRRGIFPKAYGKDIFEVFERECWCIGITC